MKKQLKKNKAREKAGSASSKAGSASSKQGQGGRGRADSNADSKAKRAVDWATLIQDKDIVQSVKLKHIAAVVEKGKDINAIVVGEEAR